MSNEQKIKDIISNIESNFQELKNYESMGGKDEDIRSSLIQLREKLLEFPILLYSYALNMPKFQDKKGELLITMKELNEQIDKVTRWINLALFTTTPINKQHISGIIGASRLSQTIFLVRSFSKIVLD